MECNTKTKAYKGLDVSYPDYVKVSALKEALDEVGHYLTTRGIRYRCIRGEIKAIQTDGGTWLIHRDEVERLVGKLSGTPSREHPSQKYIEPSSEHGYFRTLYRRYGITEEEYKQMEGEQDGKCAICKCVPKEAYSHYALQYQRLHIDHRHDDLQAVRGLLCYNCNFGIGRWLDDPELLEAAIEYLEKHSSRLLRSA